MKKIIRVAFAATFACIAGYGVYTSQQESGLSELALANIEALANGEGSGEIIKCYSSLEYELGSSVVDCANCELVENKTDKWYSLSDECTRRF